MTKYFFDTYALVEIIKNNPQYIKFSDEVVIITIFNLVELYYSILKDYGPETARNIYFKFKDCVRELEDEILFKALKLKLKFKNFSYADCIGYIYSLEKGLKFLTGDKEFKDMDNVEFIK